MKKAWIENGKIRDICPGDPVERYHPTVAAFYDTDVPDEAVNGDDFVDGVWSPAPVIVPVEPPPAPRTISTDDVRKSLTLTERVKWDAGKLDEVVTVKLEFSTPRSVEDATELLGFLVSSGIISQASMDKVLA